MIFDGNLEAPTIAHSVVYVGSHDGCLYALNGSTGELICRYQIDASVVPSYIMFPAATTNERTEPGSSTGHGSSHGRPIPLHNRIQSALQKC